MKHCTLITVILLIVSIDSGATTIYGNVTMDYIGFGAADNMKVWGGTMSGQYINAGALLFNKTAGTGDGAYLDNGRIGVFCIDLLQNVPSGSKNYDVIMPEDGPRPTNFLDGPMGEAKAGYIAELWERYYDPAWVSGGSYTTSQKNSAGAFAAAVWEIIYEDIPSTPAYWDVTLGTGFRAEGLDYQLSNSYLHSLNGVAGTDMRVLSNLCYQDFIVAVNIPEPATAALIIFGLFFGFARTRLA